MDGRRLVPLPLSQSRPSLDIFPQEQERNSSFLQPRHETSGVVRRETKPQKAKAWTSVSGQGNRLRLNDQEPVAERVCERNEGIVKFVNDCRKKKGMPEGTIPHGKIENRKRHSAGIENQVTEKSSERVE
jgi:hypothetical protein